MVAMFGTACSAAPSWIPVETTAAPATSDTADAEHADAERADAEQAPVELAFVGEPDPLPAPSDEFCTASANIWIHSAALNLIGAEGNVEMNQIAIANVAEWLERAAMFTEGEAAERAEMFAAFAELQAIVDDDFAFDWFAFQASTTYANNPSAQTYDAFRDDLVTFINGRCESLSMAELRTEAEARAAELRTVFATNPSTVVESDALPGHSIFTHASGRLIASFPSAWSYEEGRGDAIVDLIASPDIDRFLAREALDGVRLQLVEAASVDAFRTMLDETMIGSSCARNNDLSDSGVTRINITQTFDCADHGASIIGQYNESRGLGLIIEAAFDRPDASRADLIRLASIANSALWS